MSRIASLVLHSLGRRRVFFAAACSLLCGFQLLMILVARGLERSNRFSQLGVLMPDFIAQWTNMMAASFRGLVLFGYSHPVVLIFLVALAIATGSEPAAEVESKFIDLLMTRPLRRGVVIVRTVLALIVTISGAIACMLAGTWFGLKLFAPPAVIVPEARVILSLAANLALVVLAWGAVTMAVASFSKYRATATGTCGLLAFGTFILDYAGRFWDPVKGISRISLFHYFSPFEMIGGNPLRIRDVAVLVATTVVCSVVATIVYARRDL